MLLLTAALVPLTGSVTDSVLVKVDYRTGYRVELMKLYSVLALVEPLR